MSPPPGIRGLPALYSEEELGRFYPNPWKDSARRRFVKDLSRKLFFAGRRPDDNPLLDLDPRFVRWLLQFMVRHREAAQELMKMAKSYKHNLPRISEDDFRQAVDLARVDEVMRS